MDALTVLWVTLIWSGIVTSASVVMFVCVCDVKQRVMMRMFSWMMSLTVSVFILALIVFNS